MSLSHETSRASGRPPSAWFPFLLVLGIYLTLRGYHSFDGDQTYRLPLLLHRQDPNLYAQDPFVRSLDEFNPHRGSLALLDAISRPLGLPAGLFFVFVLTFLSTCRAVLRLAGAIWPEFGPAVGWVAVCLFLAAKAGNIGTNHLFEAMVLDRLVALALGWCAIADAVTMPERAWWRSSIAVAVATMVHPSVGLQLAMALGSTWLAWAVLGRTTHIRISTALLGLASIVLAVTPGVCVNLPQAKSLLGDLPAPLFWVLSVELQNPQHMLPHLWRMPQWLAWFSYLALAVLQLAESGRRPLKPAGTEATDEYSIPTSTACRWRLAILLTTILIGLGAAWYAIEVGRIVQVTVFQPFRMSTVVRGIALVVVSGRIVRLWKVGGILDRTRAVVLATGFLGDWLLVVAASGELAVSTIEAIRRSSGDRWIPRIAPSVAFGAVIAYGLNFLGHHDTDSGHVPLLIALGLGVFAGTGIWERGIAYTLRSGRERKTSRRFAVALGAAWLIPSLALLAALVPREHPASRLAPVRGLVDHCRFYPTPLDDIERLAEWCREHTSPSARFIGPPGPKTFRLWSRRSLAFNRSSSPYHGAGLADWFARFQDHVDYHGTPEEFVEAYVGHRHEFEARYGSLSGSQRAALAIRQGAGYVIAEAPKESAAHHGRATASPLELLRVEGRYAVYRVNADALVHRQP